jgi:hypothetical protein
MIATRRRTLAEAELATAIRRRRLMLFEVPLSIAWPRTLFAGSVSRTAAINPRGTVFADARFVGINPDPEVPNWVVSRLFAHPRDMVRVSDAVLLLNIDVLTPHCRRLDGWHSDRDRFIDVLLTRIQAHGRTLLEVASQ